MDDRAEMSTGRLILYCATLIGAMYAIGAVLTALTGLESSSATTGHAAGIEAATALDITSVYGTRNSTTAGVWDVRVNVELPAGAAAIDLTRLVVEHQSSNGVFQRYVHSPGALADAAAGASTFNATWTRGAGGSTFAMSPSDHVTLHFNLVTTELPTRTSARVTLTPDVGRPTTASYATPATFGTDSVVLLR